MNTKFFLMCCVMLTMTQRLFAPWGGSTIYNGDSHSSVPAFGGYITGVPGRVQDMLDPDLGPTRMSSRIACKQTCEYQGYGPCTQRDWARLK